MKKQIIDLKVNVEGVEELSDKVDAAMKLLKEASAILNDVAQNSILDISVIPSERK
ncbi:hypothetical protein ACQKDB_15880 [Planococcus kocurii]|uniref:hypothetical protein n=1 Tax=Planococcus kocurii TaxID=1374 RepID=UPI003CFFE609